MSRRNVLKHTKLFDADTINTDVTSDALNVENLDKGSINVAWSAGTSPVGTLTVEASNSTDNEILHSSGTWMELDFGVTIDVTGNSGDHQIVFESMPFRFIRLKFNSTSGTATSTATFHANTVGA